MYQTDSIDRARLRLVTIEFVVTMFALPRSKTDTVDFVVTDERFVARLALQQQKLLEKQSPAASR